MIPKVIHYCWFGRNPLPESALKCIDSWRKYLPDYEIKEWNEDNFDVNIIPYSRDAYEAKKYAFVSDYARFWILYHYGGIYFDTDVEVIKSFDDIVEKGAFMGLEIDGTKRGTTLAIAPGLGLGAEMGHPVYAIILDSFQSLSYYNEDGTRNSFTMIPLVTSLFINQGLVPNGKMQNIQGVNLYPQRYFNPYESATGRLHITPDTYSIHWYSATWMSPQPKWLVNMKRFVRRLISVF